MIKKINEIKPDIGEYNFAFKFNLFLAGSIIGASDWQSDVVDKLNDYAINVFNPRVTFWDDNLELDPNNDRFNHQVNWELDHLEISNLIFMYFVPGTKAPISLYEFGRFYKKPMIVCCPDGFWRKGNVQIDCTRDNIPLYNTLNDAIGAVKTKLRGFRSNALEK